MGSGKGDYGLSGTAISFLQEWYAGDNEQIRSKYLDKGILMENECIDFAAQKLKLGICTKNFQQFENEYMIGTPDVIELPILIDTKCCWNIKTLHSKLFGIETEYEWQLTGYCGLTGAEKGILFYGLLDTPEDANFGIEVTYDHIPDDERWVAYEVLADFKKCKDIEEKVIACRKYLADWDKKVKARLGKVMTA